MADAGRRAHLHLAPGVQLDLVGQVFQGRVAAKLVPARDEEFRSREVSHVKKVYTPR